MEPASDVTGEAPNRSRARGDSSKGDSLKGDSSKGRSVRGSNSVPIGHIALDGIGRASAQSLSAGTGAAGA